MKRLLLVLSMVALLSACVHGGAAPPKQDPCPLSKYWDTSLQKCAIAP